MMKHWRHLKFLAEIDRHLISWTESASFELEANEVMCITPNLLWARVYIEKILTNAASREGKTYRYIVYANNAAADAQDAIENAEHIINEARKIERVRENDSVSILFLADARADGRASPYLWTSGNTSMQRPLVETLVRLPVPTDIVIYKDTLSDLRKPHSQRKTFAVMSVTPIQKKILSTAVGDVAARGRSGPLRLEKLARKGFAYDIQLSDPAHYVPLCDWFNAEWESRSPIGVTKHHKI